jgi:hypothetical protein
LGTEQRKVLSTVIVVLVVVRCGAFLMSKKISSLALIEKAILEEERNEL